MSYAQLIEVNAPTLRKLVLRGSVPYEPQMLVEISKCKNLTHLALDVTEENLELWKTLFAALINLEWLYIKSSLVLDNFETLLGGCSKLCKIIVENSDGMLPSGISPKITLVSAPMGWDFADFVKTPKAVTEKHFDLV